jgi:predicted nucleic acid-binding protein
MRYVLDASVALKWVLTEPDSPKAHQVRADDRQQVHELLAPDTFPVEVAHALARAERRGIVASSQGTRLLTDVLSTPPKLHAYLPLLSRAFTIASQARIGVYDCLYVALAEQEGCEFLTADARLLNSLQPAYPFLTSLASLP